MRGSRADVCAAVVCEFFPGRIDLYVCSARLARAASSRAEFGSFVATTPVEQVLLVSGGFSNECLGGYSHHTVCSASIPTCLPHAQAL